MIEGIRKRIAEIGVRFDVSVAKEMRALYRQLLRDDGAGIDVLRDIAYGDDERQKLDLYLPARADKTLRILLFVPGGGFVGGEKDGGDGFYANLGRFFVPRGFAVAVMNYRIAPAHSWPAGHKDVGLAVRWLQENAERHGADASDVSVFGQSAGAANTLAWYFDPATARPAGISGIVLASGFYRLHKDNLAPNIVAYFGDDPGDFAERSALTHVGATGVPFLLMVAEFDPTVLAVPTFELAAKLWEANGASPRFDWLPAHNHVSPVYSIGTEDAGCGEMIERFLSDVRPKA